MQNIVDYSHASAEKHSTKSKAKQPEIVFLNHLIGY